MAAPTTHTLPTAGKIPPATSVPNATAGIPRKVSAHQLATMELTEGAMVIAQATSGSPPGLQKWKPKTPLT